MTARRAQARTPGCPRSPSVSTSFIPTCVGGSPAARRTAARQGAPRRWSAAPAGSPGRAPARSPSAAPPGRGRCHAGPSARGPPRSAPVRRPAAPGAAGRTAGAWRRGCHRPRRRRAAASGRRRSPGTPAGTLVQRVRDLLAGGTELVVGVELHESGEVREAGVAEGEHRRRVVRGAVARRQCPATRCSHSASRARSAAVRPGRSGAVAERHRDGARVVSASRGRRRDGDDTAAGPPRASPPRGRGPGARRAPPAG